MEFHGKVLVGGVPVQFYRRTTMSVITYGRESHSLSKFLKSIPKNNMAWDEPTHQLFYRDKDDSLYKLNFEKINEYDYN